MLRSFLVMLFSVSALAADFPSDSGDLDQRVKELRETLTTKGREVVERDAELTVRALVAIIDEESRAGGNRSLKHRALRELERFPNSDEAITALIREIQFEPPEHFSKKLLATYTAADVLSKMGAPARSRLLKVGMGKPLSEPELYLRGVVLVTMDFDEERKLAKEIVLKRLRHDLNVLEKDVVPGQGGEAITAAIFNYKRMISLIEDPRFSSGRIPDPAREK